MTATRVTILVPRTGHPAVEERYAYAQSRLQLAHDLPGAKVVEYVPSAAASASGDLIDADVVLVLTDPLLLAPRGLACRLVTRLSSADSDAVVPSLNESAHPSQQRPAPEPYLTLGQLDDIQEQLAANETPAVIIDSWDESDPGLYAIRATTLRSNDSPFEHALRGLRVSVDQSLFAHRFASQRGQLRPDLLERIPHSASSVLEFGCGEGALAAALKQRQNCRVVGIELDPASAAIAATRADRLLSGDVRQLVRDLDESFDWIVGGDIVEHLDDPWTFLRELRRVAKPGGRLLLSLPNLACWPVLRDLMRGRFDYVYMGITCAGHLRFFTRQTIEEMLAIAGWSVVSITPQGEFRSAGYDAFVEGLGRGGQAFSESDLLAPGYYVVAAAD